MPEVTERTRGWAADPVTPLQGLYSQTPLPLTPSPRGSKDSGGLDSGALISRGQMSLPGPPPALQLCDPAAFTSLGPSLFI